MKAVIYPVIALAILIGVLRYLGIGNDSQPANPSLKTDQKVYIAGRSEALPVGVDDEAFGEMMAAHNAGNNEALGQLVLSGRVLVCQKNQPATVLKTGLLSHRVRLLDRRGSAVDVPVEFVHAAPEP